MERGTGRAVALALRRIIGLRYILRVCGPDIPGFDSATKAIHFLLSPLIRRIWRAADKLIAKSEREIEMIHAVDPHVDCLLIPNGVDLSRFKPEHLAPDDGHAQVTLCRPADRAERPASSDRRGKTAHG
jgi:glycosyltransferase involved in cell wall biosynthesis